MDKTENPIPAYKKKDITPERNATAPELRKYDEARQTLARLNTSNTFDPSDPSHRVYVVAFDGTANDRNDPDSHRTNPDILEDLVQESAVVEANYVPGVGTGDVPLVQSVREQITGAGSLARAESVYEDLVETVQQWHAEDLSVEIHVSSIGFSRGTGSQRHFANLLDDRGIPNPDGKGYLIPPGGVVQDTLLMYDSVVTGQEDELELDIPDSVQNTVHLTAADENRVHFDLASVVDPNNPSDPGILEMELPGAHSDIGGTYEYGGLSARTLQLGHELLRQSGVPVTDMPEHYQPDPGNTRIHNSGSLWTIAHAESPVREIDVYPNPERSEFYTVLENDTLSDIARDADITVAELKRYNDLNDNVIHPGQTLRLRPPEAYIPPHRPHDGLEAAAVEPFLDDGSLNPEFVAVFDTPDTVTEFLLANSGLNLADARDAVLQHEYAAFVYDKALTEAATHTGRDVSQILNLDVPGNPDAPGYHYQKSIQGSDGVSLEKLAQFLGQNEEAVLKLTAEGKLGPALAGRQAALQQSEAVQTSVHGAASLIRGLGDGELLDLVTGLGRLGLGVDRLQDGFETGSGWLGDGDAAGLQAGLSAAAFLDDVLQGDELGTVASGAYLVDHMDAVLEGSEWQSITEIQTVGTGLSALSLYQALDGGDTASITASGFEMANTLSDGALAAELGETFGLSEAAPYAAYLRAGVQLVEGDVEQAGVTALGGYLMSTGHPVAVGAGVVLSLFGGSVFGKATPKAWADFRINTDGSIGVDVNSNSAGGGLEEPVSSLAGMLAPVIGHVRAYGVEIKPEYLPRVGIRGNEYYLQHGGGTRLITDPDTELPLLLEMNVIGHWMLENDIELWSRSGRHVYLGDTDWSHTVRGTGVFAGGGQKQHAPVTIDSKRIGSLNGPVGRTAAQQLADVKRTWRTDKSLFAGEGGALLAVGLGAGLVQYSEVAKAVNALPKPVSVTEHPATAGFFPETAGHHVIAAGYGVVDHSGGGGAGPPGPPDEPDVDFAPFYSGRRTSVYIDALGRFDGEAADQVDPNAPADVSDTSVSLPVFEDGEAVYPGEAAERIRTLAEDHGSSGPPASGGDGSGGKGGGSSGSEPAGDAGERAAIPVSHSLNVVEDRYLVTSTDRLLADDDGATFLALGAARNGVTALNPDGSIHFTPPPDFHGPAGFEYRIRTADGTVEIRQVEITVSGRNDRPHAGDDTLTGVEGGAVELTRLLTNDGDVDGDPLHIAAVGQVGTGQVEVDASGGFRYVPSPNYTGEVQWVYVVEDSAGVRTAARATQVIEEGENDPPVLPPVNLTGGVEEKAFAFHEYELLDPARDPEGGALQIQSITAVEGGAVIWDRDSGDIVFTPAPDFHGRAQLEFTVADPQGLTTTGTAGIEIENVPDPFTVGDTQLSVDQNQVIAFAPEDLLPRLDIGNPDGGEVTIVAARMAPDMPGVVGLLPDGSVQWTPPPDYSGESAFEVRLFNGVERIASRVDLDIAEVNDPPRTGADGFDAVEDQVFELNAATLLANDSDPEGDAFDVTAMRLLDPQAGVLSFDPATGDARLAPAADFFGAARLEYTVTELVSDLSGKGFATVQFVPVDDIPAVTDKSFTLAEDQSVDYTNGVLLGETIDADGETVSITAVRADDPYQGSATLLAGGGVRFTPTADYYGEAGFEFDYTDGVTSGSAIVDLVVEAINDAPAAHSHRFTDALEDQPFELDESDFLAGASDVDGDAVLLDTVALAAGQDGHLDHDPDTGRIVYTPKADFHGEVRLDYTLRDAHGKTSSQAATIVVNNVEDDFTLTDQSFTLMENETRTFTPDELLDTPADADGDALTLTAVRIDDPAAGQVELLTDGSVRFAPASGHTGPTSFEYDVTDGTHTHSAVAGLQVEPVPEPPHYLTGALEDQVFEFRSGDLPADVLAPVTGPVELAGIRMADPDTGWLAWNRETGELAFTPTPQYFGEALIEYTLVETATGRRVTNDAAIVVQGVDDAPRVTDKDLKEPALNLDEDQATIFDRTTLLDRFSDVDGQALSIVGTRMVDAARGSVALTADGGVRFEPAADYVGEAPFEIDVTDGNSTVIATMTPRLWPIHDAPRVRDDHAAMEEDTTLVVGSTDLLANDINVDGPHDGLRIVGPWAASAGVAHYDAAVGELRYTPPDDAFGDAWVDYIVEDEQGAFAVARLDVTIENAHDPVQAVDDMIVVDEDTDQLFEAAAFTGNDINPDQESLRIVAVDDAELTHGRLTLTADGRIDYQSETDHPGEQSFTYTVEDDNGHRSSATVRFIVEDVNDAPHVTPTAGQMLEDDARVFEVDELLDNALDVEDDWMQLLAARSPDGAVNFNAFAGEITFTPTQHLNTDLNGGPLLFEYLVRDEKGGETWGAMDLDVVSVNDPPQAGDDVVLAWESGPGGYVNPVAEAVLLANDIEVDGEAIRIDQVIQGANGTVTLDDANLTVGYRADSGFIGQDAFTYRVTDEVAGSDGTLSADTGTVAVHVLDNRAPQAHDFATIAPEDTVLDFGIEDFIQHVDDPDLAILELPEDNRIVAINDSVNGEGFLQPDGSVRFVPDADYNSTQQGSVASFDYVVEDIVGNRSEATASITYTPVNDDPVAVGDAVSQTIFEEQTAFINISDLLANDFDVDDNPRESSVMFDGLVGNRSEHGSIAVQGDQVRYVGDKDYSGGDSFQYRIVDDNGGADVATVQLHVANVNDAPLVEFDAARADDSGTNTLRGLLDNDSDTDGDALRIVNPSQGSVASGGTALRFDADNRSHDYNMTITYGVTDGKATVQSQVDVHVIHINRPPTSLTQIQTDTDSVFVAGNDPDTSDPTEKFLGGTLSFMGYSWNAEANTATGSGAGQTGLFIDLTNQFNHPVAWQDPNQAVITGTGTFSYTIEVSDGENERPFSGSISTPVSLRNTNFVGAGKPIIIDVNRDGFELPGLKESGAAFDWTGDGDREATGWIAGEGDAVLTYEHDGDGRVARADEISFVEYLEGARTDLEGLRAFDTTGDGVFDAGDEQWSRFGLWIDDGDAYFQDGELITMEESGIASLALHADDDGYETNGNTVFGTAEVTYSDGTTGRLGDVGFAVDIGLNREGSERDTRSASSTTDHTGDDDETESDHTSSSSAETDTPADVETSGVDDTGGHEALTDVPASEDVGGDEDRPDTGDGPSDANADSENAADTDLPDDEELDRMAGLDNAQAASQEPEETVAPVDGDAAMSDTSAANDEQDDSGEIDMAA